ncbi:acyl-CoA dehydrogenase family protein [Nocardia cyriacigeorgica]|uniref:Acyl-CoA/acyl-ACP dehydrogenase n=1 Tax=Nocardia cyriacigeorgica TaxID=135487 RepID=A0A6P1D1U5_9NOCA|nr:acyl-CoA dehydrogenase family protein [Nocardia cyriacigeorgica]NEW44446.1 acyl-CoA/acyl-ACP dehydrogenase [Nocardia cyriacigeorgica]
MDFTPTEAQGDLSRLTGEVCAKLVTDDRLRELDIAAVRFDEPLWQSLGDTGVLAAALPESVGGSDFGVLEQTSILRELGRYVAAVPYLSSIVLGAGALARYGSTDQQELARQAGAGEVILSAALTEERNWDTGKPDTTATETSDGWHVTGVKTTVPVADRAHRILVPAVTSGRTAVFLVDPSHPSVQVTAQQVVDRSAEYAVELTETPAELLGTVETGAEILDWLLLRAWLGVSAQQLGTLERALELVAEYAREREQFGKAIGSFQAVAQRLADAYIDVGGLRLTVTQAAWQLSEDLPAAPAVHTAKFWAAEAGHRVAHTVVHVHGGVGIDRDHIVQNYFTAAKHNEFALGPTPDHLLPLAQHLADSA